MAVMRFSIVIATDHFLVVVRLRKLLARNLVVASPRLRMASKIRNQKKSFEAAIKMAKLNIFLLVTCRCDQTCTLAGAHSGVQKSLALLFLCLWSHGTRAGGGSRSHAVT